LLGDVPLFDSVTLTFATAGTGGFSIKNTSMMEYSAYAQVVVTVFMALFGVSFNVYYLLLIRSFRSAFKNEELRAYLGIMIVFAVMIAFDIRSLFATSADAARHAAFQVSSIMTTTGFATADFNLWPQFSRMLLLMLMVMGASAGSTGGGIKIARFLILLKSARNSVSKVLRPNTVRLTRLNGSPLDEETIRATHAYMTIYVIIAVASILLLSLNGFSVDTNVTAVLASLNNIGPGLDDVGPMGNYAAFSPFSKLVLIANMLIGRLEILPMITLFAPSVWKR
jgi:trk system potassium uptake protein TrkH